MLISNLNLQIISYKLTLLCILYYFACRNKSVKNKHYFSWRECSRVFLLIRNHNKQLITFNGKLSVNCLVVKPDKRYQSLYYIQCYAMSTRYILYHLQTVDTISQTLLSWLRSSDSSLSLSFSLWTLIHDLFKFWLIRLFPMCYLFSVYHIAFLDTFFFIIIL